ncbi:helix-turn-helix transcriptional regulator [Rhizobium sp. AB2/73]|uniref:winged helix-turn-helix transcriptional regulator n=1 Tax=Rhizobium sp. AB2/73 TaxID=2795216 RepID=UPI001C5FF226|nr:helix-turn-helix transcriptional regulator [Rhizobium sp. AB2/73]UEQ82123.1 helix-turn-helix transcriptional regulator [Rhizobium sp. AB2/73]
MREPLLASPIDPFAAAIYLLGGKWTLRVAAVLLAGPLRFTDIRSALPGLSANALTKRLRFLESACVVQVEWQGGIPLYGLSAWGSELSTPIFAIKDWSRSKARPRDVSSSSEDELNDA